MWHTYRDRCIAAGSANAVVGTEGHLVDPSVTSTRSFCSKQHPAIVLEDHRVGTRIAIAKTIDSLVLGHSDDAEGKRIVVWVHDTLNSYRQQFVIGWPQQQRGGLCGGTHRWIVGVEHRDADLIGCAGQRPIVDGQLERQRGA